MIRARQDLGLEQVFSKEYWSEQGIWLYEVFGHDGEPTVQEIVEHHPLLRAWRKCADEEIRKSGIEVRRFEGQEWEAGRI